MNLEEPDPVHKNDWIGTKKRCAAEQYMESRQEEQTTATIRNDNIQGIVKHTRMTLPPWNSGAAIGGENRNHVAVMPTAPSLCRMDTERCMDRRQGLERAFCFVCCVQIGNHGALARECHPFLLGDAATKSQTRTEGCCTLNTFASGWLRWEHPTSGSSLYRCFSSSS